MQNYGKIAHPLTALCKHTGVLKWNEETNRAFQQLKVAMTVAPVLALSYVSKEFVIKTDASNSGIGVVLMQEGHSIAFISKALAAKHQALSAYDKEMFAILFVVKK